MGRSRDGTAFPGRRCHSLHLIFLLVAALPFLSVCPSLAAHARHRNDLDVAYDDSIATEEQNNAFLGDSTLTYGLPSELQMSSDYNPGPPEAEKQKPAVHVEQHVIVVEPEYRKVPVLKGHGFFLMGLFILAMCLSAIRSDPAARGMNFFQGVEMNARSLVKFEDVARSLFVVLAAFSAPFFLAVGAKRLYTTLPSYLKWAKDNDEIGIAQLVLLVLYSWMFFMDPSGKLAN